MDKKITEKRLRKIYTIEKILVICDNSKCDKYDVCLSKKDKISVVIDYTTRSLLRTIDLLLNVDNQIERLKLDIDKEIIDLEL